MIHFCPKRSVAAFALLAPLFAMRIGAVTFTAQPEQVKLRIPPVGTGGSVNTNDNITRSTIYVSGIDTNRQIYDVMVTFSLNHTYDGDLVITLVKPNAS